MSVETKAKKERGVVSDTEMWIGLCKLMSSMILLLPEDDQGDMIELVKEMGRARTKDELTAVEDTIREILQPKTGTAVPMLLPDGRPSKVQKWADFAGGRIREIRKRVGWTQEDLAREAGLPQSHISRIESGEISPNRITLEKIAMALKTPIGEFDPSEE
jgi:DNA-binding XRE family transcriptional regulator